MVFLYYCRRMPAADDARYLLTTQRSLFSAIGVMAAEAGISPRALLRQLRSLVRATPDPQRGLNNLHRFLSTGFSSSTLRDFHSHPLLLEVALRLFSQSQFLSDILVRSPELFSWLTATPVLTLTKTPQDYSAEAWESVQLFHRLERKLDALKRFQRRELLRIGARHLLKEADIEVTSAELASLADGIVETVLRLGHQHLLQTTAISTEPALAVIGLGKLGGEELNFSSDIDLMFVYDTDGVLDEPAERISTLHEYHNRLAEFIVRRLTEHTGEGHLYRVDMRLRPEGETGPLALSRAGYMVYYETRGEAWERQMLLKARVLAGKKSVGERWLREIEPFVYPKTVLGSPLLEIARMKARIESKVDAGTNIKLGAGGIRDIEFSVQALQLLNAGPNPALRERGTLRAVRALQSEGLLSGKEQRVLEGAYRFLRHVEDRLQLLHGLQRHQLPETKEEMAILAKQLGAPSTRSFEKRLANHRAEVRRVFTSVFHGKGKPGRAKPGGDLRIIDSTWFKKIAWLHPEETAGRLDSIAHELPEVRGVAEIKRLAFSTSVFGAPDWCIKNLLILSSSRPLQRTLQQAVQNPQTLNLLLLICSRSANLSRSLAQEPLLFESLVGRTDETLGKEIGWEFLRLSDPVRFRKYNEFRIIVRWLLKMIPIGGMLSEMNALAEDILLVSCERLERKWAEGKKVVPFALLALGKFGGREINVVSDLDLVFFYEEGEGSEESKRAQQFVRELVRDLEGVYEIDLQLRPEGKNSPPATEWNYYREYLRKRASLWERQSLTKSRVVAGMQGFRSKVTDVLNRHTYHAPLPPDWIIQIKTMREAMERERAKEQHGLNLKAGKGGMIDLEFFVQILALRHGREGRAFSTCTFEALEEFVARRIVTRREYTLLRTNLVFLRSLETLVRINADSTDFILPDDPERISVLAAGMDCSTRKSFLARIATLRKQNRSLLLQAYKRGAKK